MEYVKAEQLEPIGDAFDFDTFSGALASFSIASKFFLRDCSCWRFFIPCVWQQLASSSDHCHWYVPYSCDEVSRIVYLTERVGRMRVGRVVAFRSAKTSLSVYADSVIALKREQNE